MQKLRRYLLAFLVLAGLTGCSYFQFPGVYKISVQQGNIVTEEMLGQLKPGMTKRQVRFVMGTPLITDTFNPNRWDYYYSMLDPKGKTTQKQITIFFANDRMTHYTGDVTPNTEKNLTAQQ